MQKFIRFAKEELPELKPRLIFMSAFAGLMNGVALAVVLNAASDVSESRPILRDLLLFLTSVGLFAYAKKYALDETVRIAEGMIRGVRLRISRSLRTLPVYEFERISTGKLQAALSSDVQVIPQYAAVLMGNLASMVMLVFVFGYLFFLSPAALLLVAASAALCIVYFLSKQGALNELNAQANQAESGFYNNLNNLISGFKELKISRKKANAFFGKELDEAVRATTGLRTQSALITNHMVLLGSLFLFINLAGILFILPKIDPGAIGSLTSILAVVLFSLGPIADIVAALPMGNRAMAAIDSINHLEAEIEARQSDREKLAESIQPSDTAAAAFRQIELRNLTYQYPNSNGRTGFKLGPVSMHLDAGEIVFLVGGNGSGKSTFLKAFTSLYPTEPGQIILNGSALRDDQIADYRSLFSPIFSDFFLFDRLIGLDGFDKDQFYADLEAMCLAGKIHLDPAGRVNHKDLSTGQRKRLALVLATMDPKPIYIFDEWAADQDPEFRANFYNTFLPRLKAEGSTVLAATHDDHYFSRADRIIRLEYGAIAP